MINRRGLLAEAGALAASSMAVKAAGKSARAAFPKGFLWGVASAPYQIEGNNLNSDLWPLEYVKGSIFKDKSGDACNSFELWQTDLDIIKKLGLNTYRFGVEWSRIEPESGDFSVAMLDYYQRMIDGCHARGLTPVITFNHYTAPIWFSANGGWLQPDAPKLFARFCDRVARAMGDRIAYAITMNEPNLPRTLKVSLPPIVWKLQKQTLEAVARKYNVKQYVCVNVADLATIDPVQKQLLVGHKMARAAIKAACPKLPVGFSLSVYDDEAKGPNSVRDKMRQQFYGPWLDLARQDDFIGAQNYERMVWDANGRVPVAKTAVHNWSGSEVYAPSLANSVRFLHQATGKPVLVSEHGVGTDDDRIRAKFIPDSLKYLHQAMAEGVPVIGYCHWSLLDNFEWIFGYKPHFGLCSTDRTTFKRTPKPSALVYGRIARANAV